MWIPMAISDKDSEAQALGVTLGASDGETVNLPSMSSGAVMFCPFGVASVPPEGTQAIAFQTGGGLSVCGVKAVNSLGLEPGEVALFSLGGASIVLKNDGRVLINGKEYEA